ncbi:SseB family protein [Humibacter sp. BT305]|nr:SseB family protein [Humibacter sp. BT305]
MARPAPAFPKTYANRPLRTALEAFAAHPDESTLEAMLDAMTRGGLVIDLTGTTDAGDPQARTILSTDGRQILPLFSSVTELRAAVPPAARKAVRATILPAPIALRLVEGGDIVAVQFDAGSIAQIVTRPFVDRALARLSPDGE